MVRSSSLTHHHGRAQVASALGTAILLSVLLASCRHVEPRHRVLHGVTCESRGEPSCIACIQTSCCTELLACAGDAPCPCELGARVTHLPADKTLEQCGPPNASFTALASCIDAHCASDCAISDLRKHPLVGKPAPEVIAEPLGGDGPKTLTEARGKIVILDFWATWCGPCRKSFPKYQEILDRFPNDVAVLAVSVDDSEHTAKEKILGVARDAHVKFSILWDMHLRMEARYTMPNGLPAAFVIDRTGTVRSVHVGYDAAMLPRIEALVASREKGEVVP